MADAFCGRLSSCLELVPCPSLLSWILLTVSVTTCCGSLVVGARRTRQLLQDDKLLCEADVVCLSVLAGTVALGIIFLVIASLSSAPQNQKLFGSSKKNICAIVLNYWVIVILTTLIACWIVVAAILSAPVFLFILLHVLYVVMKVDSINLKNYALKQNDYILSGTPLSKFYAEGQEVFICYAIAFVAAILVSLSLVAILVCTAANLIHLKALTVQSQAPTNLPESKSVGSSKNSVIDTRL